MYGRMAIFIFYNLSTLIFRYEYLLLSVHLSFFFFSHFFFLYRSLALQLFSTNFGQHLKNLSVVIVALKESILSELLFLIPREISITHREEINVDT